MGNRLYQPEQYFPKQWLSFILSFQGRLCPSGVHYAQDKPGPSTGLPKEQEGQESGGGLAERVRESKADCS